MHHHNSYSLTIPISFVIKNETFVARVSPQDADLAACLWHAQTTKGRVYIYTYVYVEGKRKKRLLHREIVSRIEARALSPRETCKHRTLDTLDCTRENVYLVVPKV